MYLRPECRFIIDLCEERPSSPATTPPSPWLGRVSGSIRGLRRPDERGGRALGLTHLHFVEPSGLSELNRITAREYAMFCMDYMQLHPQAMSELHSLRYIEFPKPENATPDYSPAVGSSNTTSTAWSLHYPGCDGLETGYINESGYNLAATAGRNGTRFIIVTLGGSGAGSALAARCSGPTTGPPSSTGPSHPT